MRENSLGAQVYPARPAQTLCAIANILISRRGGFAARLVHPRREHLDQRTGTVWERACLSLRVAPRGGGLLLRYRRRLPNLSR